MSSQHKPKVCDLRVTELRAELENRELESAGKKADLVDRLKNALKEEGHDPETYVFEDKHAALISSIISKEISQVSAPEDMMEMLAVQTFIDGLRDVEMQRTLRLARHKTLVDVLSAALESESATQASGEYSAVRTVKEEDDEAKLDQLQKSNKDYSDQEPKENGNKEDNEINAQKKNDSNLCNELKQVESSEDNETNNKVYKNPGEIEN
ncbi:pharyngeal muscle protein 2-like [Diabrotica virgifera virgifera]|uniref:SAP domain-containing protein n=1 Tax=Diabrotica virgifera virgifera TaxID=50390 RepID=A0ABM5L2K8_DIAVI|nr:pharyngeal muscle protein 2-like [Diabrotica virgifera virgifera]